MTINLILLVLSFVCFVLAALNVPSPRVSLTPLGLAFWTLSLLIGAHI